MPVQKGFSGKREGFLLDEFLRPTQLGGAPTEPGHRDNAGPSLGSGPSDQP